MLILLWKGSLNVLLNQESQNHHNSSKSCYNVDPADRLDVKTGVFLGGDRKNVVR